MSHTEATSSQREASPDRNEGRQRTWQRWLLLLPAGIVFVVVFVAPQTYLFFGSAQPEASPLEPYARVLSDGYYLGILGDTIAMGAITTVITLLLGYPLAFWLARTNSRWKTFCLVITIFPLLTSAVVRTFGWQVLLYKSGLLGMLAAPLGLDGPSGLMGTMTGVVIALAEVLLPFMVITLYGVIESVDATLEDAAMDLGDNQYQALWRVTIPLSKGGILGGSLLVFSLAVSSFVTPSLIGGSRVQVMATVIYERAIVLLDYAGATVLSVILLATVLLIIGVYSFLLRDTDSKATS